MKQEDIWRGIDRLAAQKGLSPSGLAKRAGLNLSTFNKNKRGLVNGQPRWIRMETLNKVLVATNTSISEFCQLMYAVDE